VPAFDLGLVPSFTKTEPLGDEGNDRLTQRVPFDVSGEWNGCPVDGFAWSELLANWYGWEDSDPWFTGGRLPVTPKRCGARVKQPPLGPTGDLNPPHEPLTLPNLVAEFCTANADKPRCEYRAKSSAGIIANGNPGGWTVTIQRPGKPEPVVLTGHGGFQAYACDTVKEGDYVVAVANGSSAVTVGDPGFCL
jgi:hypothetical protein